MNYKLIPAQNKDHNVFNILNQNVLKQEKLKAIRNENKAKIPQLTEENITNAVWKYRYVSPGLDTKYFERNRYSCQI
jgi:Tfp pilus assembly protein PilW